VHLTWHVTKQEEDLSQVRESAGSRFKDDHQEVQALSLCGREKRRIRKPRRSKSGERVPMLNEPELAKFYIGLKNT